ncbi:MAG: DUF2141 domain-containing protein [Treponema sp.]|nr:DUF2141 domain-containing protein [Treponema sp.]
MKTAVKKIAFVLFFMILCVSNSFAENIQVTIEITNVIVNDGNVFLAIFFNADEFRREEPSIAFELESNSTVLRQEVTLPPGEYLVSAFQDRNGNGQLDFNFLGIPRELVGISNFNGRGFPSRNFNRHKIPVSSSTGIITIALHRF